jgi:Flp pilus assembly protein CpaB
VKRSNRLVILVGVLLAVLAFVLVVVLLNNRSDASGPNAEPTTATVLVATEDIAIGDAVTPDKVEATQVPLDAASTSALSDPSQVAGQTALIAVPQGSQVTADVIGRSAGGINVSAQLLPGEKAIAVRLDPTTGVNFLIEPGDQIDIIVSEQIQVLQETADSVSARATDPDLSPRFEAVTGLEAARTVKTVLQNKRVLYVSATNIPEQPDPNATPAPDGAVTAPVEIVSTVVVFAGTDQDAEILKFAQRDQSELSSEATQIPGSVTVVIRADNDEAVETTTGITIDQLVANYGLPVPGIVNLEELPPTP